MTNWRKVFSLPARGAVDPMRIHKVLGVGSSTVAAWYAGYTSSGDLVDITGNGRTLADAGSPTIGKSSIQGADGNRLQSFAMDGTDDSFSLAHASWMNIFDGDFALSLVVQASTAGSGQDDLFLHSDGTDGLKLFAANTTGYVTAEFYPATIATVTGPSTSIRDGYWHVITLVRSSNIARIFVDGVAGTPVSVASKGTDVSSTLYLGGATNFYQGSITYARINNAALTDAQIAREVALWQGAGLGTTWGPSLDFARAGTAYQTYSDGTMALRSAGIPRVGDGILVEGAATNLFGAANQRNVDGVGWSKSAIEDTHLNTGTGPDGVVYLDTIHESVANDIHILYQTKTLDATPYTISAIFQNSGGRNFGGFYIGGALDKAVIWNLTTGQNTLCEAGWTANSPVYLANGNIRLSATITGPGASISIGIIPSSDGTSHSYAGDVTKGIIVGDMVLETGSFPTSIPDSSTGTRIADDLSIPTYRLRNTLKDVITTTPTMWYDFNTDPSGSTVTSTDGGYTLTKTGQPKRYTSPIYGDHHVFDGATDKYTTTIANPSGDFSICGVIVPDTVSGAHVIASKWNTTGDKRGWTLYQNNATLVLSRSTDGASGTVLSATLSACLVAKKPTFFTATYSTTGGLTVRADALTAATQAATGAVYASDALFTIGNDAGGSGFFGGKMCFLEYIDGTVLSAQNHADMYAALKLPGILPVSIGHDTHYTKLRIKGEYKHVGLATVPTSGYPFYFSINDSGDDNRIIIYGYSDTLFASIYTNEDVTQRYMSLGGISHNQYNKFDIVFDLSNLASSYGYLYKNLSTVATSFTNNASLAGSDKHVLFIDTSIRIGQNSNGVVNSNSHFRNLEIMIA